MNVYVVAVYRRRDLEETERPAPVGFRAVAKLGEVRAPELARLRRRALYDASVYHGSKAGSTEVQLYRCTRLGTPQYVGTVDSRGVVS